MIIAISGRSGSGNSTVSELVAKKLGLRFINYTFRNYAEEHNIPFKEVLALAERNSKVDKVIDQKQIELASQGNCVLASRLAVWLLKEANVKIFLTASQETRARRIQVREGGDFSEKLKRTIIRDKRDHKRFLKTYKINNVKYEFVDVIINTEHFNPDEIALIIIAVTKNHASTKYTKNA